jgi:hypothetical protein
VTGGGDARSAGAARQARYRERRRAERLATVAMVEAGVAEARQEMLPLAPIGELEELPPGALVSGGRPAGSVARTTAQMRDYLLQRYQSPLVGLAEIAGRPARDLAVELGCTPLEAFDRQLKAMAELAPYVHSKMPAAVQLDGAPIVPLVLAVSPEMAARMGGATIEHDQPLSGDAAP